MKKIQLLSALFLLMAFSFTSCLQDDEEVSIYHYTDAEYAIIESSLTLDRERDNYNISFPEHMTRRNLFPPAVSDAKATLGRVLFYDKKLSKNNTISCASCHKQSLGFADDKAFSTGFEGGSTKRNSLALAAVVNFPTYYGSATGAVVRPLFMWDERAATVLEQSTLALEDDIEMGMDMHDLASKVGEIDYYQVLFYKAFGESHVTKERLLDAIQEFVNSFVSADSDFDDALSAENSSVNIETTNFAAFTTEENDGKRLFMEKCSSCHSADMSTPVMRFANNGLDLNSQDPGIGAINGVSGDVGKFKVPPLRNIEFTAPYMHDGRFATLDQVLEHYSHNLKDNPALDSKLRSGGQPMQMNFSAKEKSDLIAFMKTLTDNTFLQAKRFSDPFNQ